MKFPTFYSRHRHMRDSSAALTVDNAPGRSDSFYLDFKSSTQLDRASGKQQSSGNALAGVSGDRDSTSLCPAECLSGEEPAQGVGTESHDVPASAKREAGRVAGFV